MAREHTQELVNDRHAGIGLAWFIESEDTPATYPPMGGDAEQLPWQPMVTGTPNAITALRQALDEVNEDVHYRVFISGCAFQNTALFLYWLREVADGTRKHIEVTLNKPTAD